MITVKLLAIFVNTGKIAGAGLETSQPFHLGQYSHMTEECGK